MKLQFDQRVRLKFHGATGGWRVIRRPRFWAIPVVVSFVLWFAACGAGEIAPSDFAQVAIAKRRSALEGSPDRYQDLVQLELPKAARLLAMGAIGEFPGGSIGAAVVAIIWPTANAALSDLDNAISRIEKNVDKRFSARVMGQAQSQTGSLVSFLNDYMGVSSERQVSDELWGELIDRERDFEREAVTPLMSPDVSTAALPAFMTTAGVHLNLLQEVAKVDLARGTPPGDSLHHRRIRTKARDYVAYAEETRQVTRAELLDQIKCCFKNREVDLNPLDEKIGWAEWLPWKSRHGSAYTVYMFRDESVEPEFLEFAGYRDPLSPTGIGVFEAREKTDKAFQEYRRLLGADFDEGFGKRVEEILRSWRVLINDPLPQPTSK